MAGDRIQQIHEKISERAGDTITCPICRKQEWTTLDDTVLTVLSTSENGFRRANAPEYPPVEEGDHWSTFTAGAFCPNCGFLRLHLVDPEGLLK